MARESQRRFRPHAAIAVQDLVRHAEVVQYAGIVADMILLLLSAEKLERAALTMVVLDAGLASNISQHVPAVLCEPHHPALVAAVRVLSTVRKHPREPTI
jgi:hypothetical protein